MDDEPEQHVSLVASMAAVEQWTPPPDPDFDVLEARCDEAWAADKPKVVAFDTETSGFEHYQAAFCATVAWEGLYGTESHYIELDNGRRRDLLTDILCGAEKLVGHNIKFDLVRAHQLGIYPEGELHDTEALAHLDWEHRPKGLKSLAVELLEYSDTIRLEIKSGKRKGEFNEVPREKWEIEQAKKWAKKKYELDSVNKVGYDLLPRGTVVPYALKDAEWTFNLYMMLRPRVERYEDLWALYQQEMKLTSVLLDMEQKGMKVRPGYVKEKVREYSRRVFDIEQRIEALVGKAVRTGKIPPKERKHFFNPSSSSPDPKEYLAAAGFERDSYDADNLKTIDHPLAHALLELRANEKILSTYLKPILEEERDGIVHPNLRQHGTATGRMSSGKETGQ